MRQAGSSIDLADWRLTQTQHHSYWDCPHTVGLEHTEYREECEELRTTITTSRRGGMASGGEQRVSSELSWSSLTLPSRQGRR